MATRPRGVLVFMLDGTTIEYPKADAWKFEELGDGVWLHLLCPDGEQEASFRPKTYDRPQAGRVKADG